MTHRILSTFTLLALTAWSTLALAQAPAQVGRIALVQGDVRLSTGQGGAPEAALRNWPVTSGAQLSTWRDARTEIKIGSTAIRLDADSALDITELSDDRLQLRLHYGSASVRIRNPDLAPGFELSTPQGAVRMRHPGRIRIDAARHDALTEVTVFDGEAQVEGGGVRLTVFAGKRAEFSRNDVRTALAVPDGFDDWAMLRDRRDQRSEAVRYVSDEMTGYEDLDQHGIWREHRDYGALWLPRGMPVSWAPYRDGRWTFIAPWGWTWVDNAPWGYAPFHYGRWVRVDQRWGWAPGRRMARPIWAPALVGWVGGNNWSLNFSQHGSYGPTLAQGWYPLSPFEAYAPSYRLSRDHLNYLNHHARPDYRRNWHGHDRRGDGLTVVPQNRFTRQGTVYVPAAPKAVVAPIALQAAPALAPAAPRTIEQDPRREPHRDLSWRRKDRVPTQPEMRGEPRPQQVRQVLPAPPRVQQFTPAQPIAQPRPQAVQQPMPQPSAAPVAAPQHSEPARPVRQPRSGQIKERIQVH